MTSPDLSLGVGSIVYALAKLDGQLQPEEVRIVREHLAQEPHGELALYAFFLRENCDEDVEEAYAFGIRRFLNQPQPVDETVKKRVFELLVRVAHADDDMSRKERELIQRFRRDVRRC